MIIFSKVTDFLKWRSRLNSISAQSIGFIPTMGALHKGHASLIQEGRNKHDIIIVSIYVNKLQFNDLNDYENYPNSYHNDLRICEELGVDVMFIPEVGSLYHASHTTYVEVEELSNTLCGKSRPGHFRGVCTIVAKLFNLVRPSIAYFGAKDFQQFLIIKKMVRDLNIPIEVKALPTVRESSGLAMSSRNERLLNNTKIEAQAIYRGLQRAYHEYQNGERRADRLITVVKKSILNSKFDKIDYISIVSQQTLEPLEIVKTPAIIAVSIIYGQIKLVDNIFLE